MHKLGVVALGNYIYFVYSQWNLGIFSVIVHGSLGIVNCHGMAECLGVVCLKVA